MRSLACLPLSGSNLSINCRISRVRGMGSLPLLPRELDVANDAPPLSMPELRDPLSFPPDTLPFSSRGENRLCRVVVLPMFTNAGPL